MTKKFYIVDKKTSHIMSRGYDTALIANNASAKYTWFNPEKHEVAYGENAGASEELVEQPKDEYLGFYMVNHNTFKYAAGPYTTQEEAHQKTKHSDWYKKAPNDFSILYGTIDEEGNFDEADE